MTKRKTKIWFLLILALLIFAVAVPLYVSGSGGPSQVNNLTIERTNGNAHLSWEGVSGSDYYIIYRDGEKITTTRDVFYIDRGLKSNQNYLYEVAAVSDGLIGQFNNINLEAIEKEPKETPEKALEVVSTLSYLDGSNNPAIVGEINNNMDVVIENIEVNASFYLGNEFLGSKKTHYQYHETFGFNYLRENETIPFRAYISMEHNEVISKVASNLEEEIRFNVEVVNYSVANQSIYLNPGEYEGKNSSVATLKPYVGYDVSHSGSLSQDEEEFLVDVEFSNVGGKEVEETVVCGVFYNESNKIVGFEKTTIEEAPSPGESEEISLSFDEKYFKLEGGGPLDSAASFSELIDSYKVYVRGVPQSTQ